MKKNINYIVFLLFLLIVTSCKKWLTTQPTDFVSQTTYWQSSEDVLDALTGCYRALNSSDLYGSQLPFMFECMSPNAFNYDNQGASKDIAAGNQTGTTLGINLNNWNGCYRGIGRCNTILDNIDKVSSIDQNLKVRISGEAKFLRAFFYYRLNVVFNGVPLILNQPDPKTDGELGRNTYDEVNIQIVKDLDDAIESLPSEYSSADGGRASKGAAIALKARVLLQNHKYEEVIRIMEDKFFPLGVNSLFPDYNGIFRKANEGNSEVIFDIRFKAPDLTNSYDIIMAQYDTQAPLQDLVDEYEMKDGKSILESDLYDPYNPYMNRDPRFEQAILYVGVPWRQRTATTADLHQTGYSFRKFTEYNESTVGTISNSDVNYVEIRYADVLLMYAEAENEVNGPTPKVYDAINSIRQRPTVNMPELNVGLSKDAMRAAIRHERRIELAGEGSYFYDIRRWNIIEEVMNGPVYDYKGDLVQNRKFDSSRDWYWPIPFSQIDLNNNLAQNPGYH